jgi:hypothetical protein
MQQRPGAIKAVLAPRGKYNANMCCRRRSPMQCRQYRLGSLATSCGDPIILMVSNGSMMTSCKELKDFYNGTSQLVSPLQYSSF